MKSSTLRSVNHDFIFALFSAEIGLSVRFFILLKSAGIDEIELEPKYIVVVAAAFFKPSFQNGYSQVLPLQVSENERNIANVIECSNVISEAT